MADFTLTTRNEGNVVIIETSGYLNIGKNSRSLLSRD